MSFPRASGLLLHPTSLPGQYGIGDLGSAAFRFVDFLVRCGQTYWQTLPLGPVGAGNSPYSAYSTFAGNILLISPENLLAEGLLVNADLRPAPYFGIEKVAYESVTKWKHELTELSFDRFRNNGDSRLRDEFDGFSIENAWWLDDYAMFAALKLSHDGKPWFEWAEPIRLREGTALDRIKSQLSRELLHEKFRQFLFFRQWAAIKRYANENGVKIIGDLPIFVALDSADVWCNQKKFKLNDDGSPTVIAGVPPDFFSETGQLWGNPIYDWEAMRLDNFNWWTARVAFAMRMFDAVRLDHFIGFIRNWEVPATDRTAENGVWVQVPGRALFETLRKRLGPLQLIAEDLGAMTPEVEQLRDEFGLPGMRIVQYAFGGDANNRDLPHNYVNNTVAYTGTHDNDTIKGWYKSSQKNVKAHFREYVRANGREPHWDMIRAASASVANTVIIPVQDILGLGSEARMNIPATEKGNWEWRMSNEMLNDQHADKLYDLTKLYGRLDTSHLEPGEN